jgi:hypothetical protein
MVITSGKRHLSATRRRSTSELQFLENSAPTRKAPEPLRPGPPTSRVPREVQSPCGHPRRYSACHCGHLPECLMTWSAHMAMKPCMDGRSGGQSGSVRSLPPALWTGLPSLLPMGRKNRLHSRSGRARARAQGKGRGKNHSAEAKLDYADPSRAMRTSLSAVIRELYQGDRSVARTSQKDRLSRAQTSCR